MNYDRLLNQEPLNKIDAKHDSLRFVLFNINGVKTLFNYFPWTHFRNNFNCLFKGLKADVITLQELKLTNENLSSVQLANIPGYKSFLSLPRAKKGYSGVGLFVRIPDEHEDDKIKFNLKVLKAEEGLTGHLKSPLSDGLKRYIDLSPELSIGGYPENIDESLALDIDSQGRCVVIELATNIVIFALYCPANSMGTDEGHIFKLKFMEVLIDRCKFLKFELKKEVIIIGDLNVHLDLIDQADAINERKKKKLVSYTPTGDLFEKANLTQCVDFKFETFSRKLMNTHVYPTIGNYDQIKFDNQFLYDTTRLFQKRRMGLYTVWNTMTGARQTNYGSRIDLILTSNDFLAKNITNANAWPFLMGSDHCPVFTDFKFIEDIDQDKLNLEVDLPFEAQYYYKLIRHHDITTMFTSKKRSVSSVESNNYTNKNGTDSSKEKPIYKSRKPTRDQLTINHFFFKRDSSTEMSKSYIQETLPKTPRRSLPSLFMAYGEPPKCRHGLPCELKTSLNNPDTRGKKFWCCSKNLGLDDNERCSFFQWLNG